MKLPFSAAKDDSNISGNDYSDPDTEFHEIQDDYMDPNSVWDRGKLTNELNHTAEDLVRLRRLENTVTSLESCLDSLPVPDTSMTSRNLAIPCPSPIQDDTLSDVDLDRFDASNTLPNENRFRNVDGDGTDAVETASLSDFHNIRDVLLNIRERLDSYLKINQDSSADDSAKSKLEDNISELKRELERYVESINEKKENELRKFSENMINQSNIRQMKKAFSRKEKLQSNIYETLTKSHAKYALANAASLPKTLHCFNERSYTQEGFTMRNCYDNDYVFQTYSDFSSVEYYTMLINEERSEKLLNDAPLPIRYHEREKISLIFRDPENIIKQWQNYQLKTIKIKPKKEKSLKLKWKNRHKLKQQDVWGFTLDYHQNRILQMKLEKERRFR